MSKKDKDADLSPLQGENQFLTRLVLGLLALSIVSASYTVYFTTSVVGPGEEGLESGSVEGVNGAIAALSTTHIFSNIVTPKSFIPSEDPVLGGKTEKEALDALSEEALAAADAGVQQKTNESIESVRTTLLGTAPEEKEKREFLKTTLPTMAAWTTLEKGKFSERQLRTSNGSPTKLAKLCGEFAPCAKSYVQRSLPRLAVMGMLIDSRKGDNSAWTEGELTLAYRFPTALIKAAAIHSSDRDYSDDEKKIVGSLLEAQKIATKNGRLFSIFVFMVLIITVITRYLSDRIKPEEYV